jgi:hypothetical protein
MTLKRRLRQLEASLESQDAMQAPAVGTDDVMRDLGLDPGAIRARASATGQSIMAIVARELGLDTKDFQSALILKVRGGHPAPGAIN